MRGVTRITLVTWVIWPAKAKRTIRIIFVCTQISTLTCSHSGQNESGNTEHNLGVNNLKFGFGGWPWRSQFGVNPEVNEATEAATQVLIIHCTPGR